MKRAKRAPRKPLSLAPTYGSVEAGRDAYLDAIQLRPLAHETKRYWSFHSTPTTVALSENRYAKSLKPFTHHTDEHSFRDLLAEYSEAGCPRPSGYADVFHERFKSPRVNYSINSLLAPGMAGGWQESIKPGAHAGVYHRYDMRSAYLWAASLGLPDTITYTRSLSSVKNGGRDGIYRVKLLRPVPGAPFPFNSATEVIATANEIEVYSLPIAEYVAGVTWSRLVSPEPLLNAIRAVSTWKLAGRSFWGRWAQLAQVVCHSPEKQWALPSASLNIPWAHVIVSRVKMRLWECSTRAVHVFVDSVITSDTLPLGDSLGDWRLEKTYEHGVLIKAPGQYGGLSAPVLDRMTGAPVGSPRRAISHAIGA